MKQQIVITDSVRSFEQYCTQEGRDRSNTAQVSQPFQLKFYPDAEIVIYGDYARNACWDSPELREIQDAQALRELEEQNKKP